MKIILDTHIFLWALSDPGRLSQGQRAAIESLANVVYVSSISVAEIMIKASIGKLDVDFDPMEQIEACGFEPLSFCGEDACLLRDMPFHHRDPFDRMLIAQSKSNGFPIVTNDVQFAQYGCELV